MRILLIEDEKGMVRFIRKGLQEEGFIVDAAESAEEAQEEMKGVEYDLVILDIMLPKMNGFDFLTHLRKRDKDILVLILTAQDGISDKRQGFQSHCDDYLTKPFHFEELLLRIHSLLRRQKNEVTQKSLSMGLLKLDPDRFQVHFDSAPVPLTRKEFALLRYFLANQNRVLSRTQILNHVWQHSFDVGTNVLDVTINSLRKKIPDSAQAPKIVTVYGVGYALQEASLE